MISTTPPQVAPTKRDDASALAVVSGSPVIRTGLAALLADVPWLVVRDQVDSITTLLAQAPPPAIIVLDLHGMGASPKDEDFWTVMPAGSRIVALCSSDDPPDLVTALQGGAHAFLTRDFNFEGLILAVRTAFEGSVYVAAELLDILVRQAATTEHRVLADREIETLRWIASGLTHGQVGRRMGLTEATVSTYVKRLRAKLNAGNKAELTRRAIELGYLGQLSNRDGGTGSRQ